MMGMSDGGVMQLAGCAGGAGGGVRARGQLTCGGGRIRRALAGASEAPESAAQT